MMTAKSHQILTRNNVFYPRRLEFGLSRPSLTLKRVWLPYSGGAVRLGFLG